MRYIHDIIIGGVDGTLSSFAFLAMLRSAAFPKQYILLILVLKLLSDGVSLSLSNYSGRSSVNEVREALEAQMQTEPDKDRSPNPNPYAAGVATLIGFLLFGSVPILIYHYVLHDLASIWISALLILSVLFLMGVLKSYTIHKNVDRVLHGGIQFGIVGMVGITASVTIGLMIKQITGRAYN